MKDAISKLKQTACRNGLASEVEPVHADTKDDGQIDINVVLKKPRPGKDEPAPQDAVRDLCSEAGIESDEIRFYPAAKSPVIRVVNARESKKAASKPKETAEAKKEPATKPGK